MGKSIEALVYKGSIIEAITEAKSQKKLFVVCISGEDENSILLEQSTWVDQNVHETIIKCCIFLHLIQGSVDASQFSAIYPQKSVPSISAIGLNGVLLWHHEGYIDAEILRENIEKSFATLHIQETAATLLTAALASHNTAPVSGASAAHASTEGGTSLPDTPSTSSSREATISDLAPTPQPKVDTSNRERSFDSAAVLAAEECKEKDEAKVVSISKKAPAVKISPRAAVKKKTESSAMTSLETKEKSDEVAKKEVVISNDVYLNIRMPNGTSLQIKLVKSDALRSVKNFVDEQQDTRANTYNLAVPYPRKLFNEEDMDRTLSELGFTNRETLIVVRHQSTASSRAQPAANNSMNRSQDTSNPNGTGYFSYLRLFLSYVNPFSYFGGSTTTANPNTPTNSQNPFVGEGTPQVGQSSVNATQRITSRSVGSNIRTLRHDGSSDAPRDRNTFWNGNSTEFGSSDQQ